MPLTRRELLAAVTAIGAAAAGGKLLFGRQTQSGPASAASPAPSAVSNAPMDQAVPPGAVPSSVAPSTVGTVSTVAPATSALSSSTPSGPARFVRNGERTRRQVALTFHGAGDPAITDAMIAALQRASAPVTVFAVGSWLDENPQVAGRLLGAGHELANHTYTHPTLGRSSAAQVADEIGRCREVLARAAGPQALRWFRPSGIEIPTDTILTKAGELGYPTVVGYDVDSLDFEDPGVDAVVANVEAGLQPGSIISLHLGHADTVTAMPRVLALLDRGGLRPVTISALLVGEG